MEEQIIIEIDGKDYPVKNPTLHNWAILNLMKDLEEDDDFMLTMVSLSTGIEEDLLKQANFLQVKKASNFLTDYFIKIGERFYPEFEFQGKEYKFLDINDMSFGHYVDIDTFLQKDESYKKSNMNELVSMLYLEKGEESYSGERALERKDLFKDLEVKYLQGALTFFLLLGKVLRRNTPYYLKTKWKVMRILRKFKPLRLFGVGMGLLYSWLTKTLKNWRK